MSTPLSYTGDEPSFAWDATRKPRAAGLFDMRPPSVPIDAKPIYDADLDCIIGYQKENAGVFRIYTLDGDISVSEKPLEAPLLDPLDVLFMVGGIWRVGVRGLTDWGVKAVGASLERATLFGLRSRYYALMQRPLRFAPKPLMHMKNSGRYVPVHILRLVIKYGERTPDPRGKAGIFMYTHPIARDGKAYMLEVLVRDSDYTVLHFVYKPLQ
ncbi:conserved hypothetical protein [Paraburkholderia piptadeniae]|uniref:Uncharacterized protein n=1 Tax=Paraburkholderia piptadeniae TaxID=1701573 RepID=A0A1N7SJ69_9BURK|nr:hypothetical protein [Paraburkholderia piptadeniae]SIT47441.1 conserved hypothetical protein [Paraburkholderia piptadeniae]